MVLVPIKFIVFLTSTIVEPHLPVCIKWNFFQFFPTINTCALHSYIFPDVIGYFYDLRRILSFPYLRVCRHTLSQKILTFLIFLVWICFSGKQLTLTTKYIMSFSIPGSKNWLTLPDTFSLFKSIDSWGQGISSDFLAFCWLCWLSNKILYLLTS